MFPTNFTILDECVCHDVLFVGFLIYEISQIANYDNPLKKKGGGEGKVR